MPTPGLVALFGTVLLGAVPGPSGPLDAPATPEPGRSWAIDIPARSGLAAFEVPADLAANHELFLIVSALAPDGPYSALCSLGRSPDGLAHHDLRSIGTVLPRAVGAPAPPSARPRKPAVPEDEGRPAAPRHPPLRRTFSVLARPGDPRLPSHYELVEARLRAVGERIQVFVDEDDLAIVGDEALRTIVSSFDRVIEPRLSARLGPVRDVDRDGRLAVLLSRRVALPFPDRSHVDGYFRSADLDEQLPRPLSNRADLIYLHAEIGAGPYLETILAHEYAHAVLESRRRDHRGAVDEESWLDEAMAHLCEDIVGQSARNLDYRVSAFLSEPNRYRVVVDDEHRPGLFRSHGNRGAAYLFLRWCAETFDPDLVLTLCTQGLTGLPNLERATGLPFDDLYRRWTIAMALSSLGEPADGSHEGGGIDLLGTIGDRPLGGLRFERLGPGDPELAFPLEGTSSQYLRLTPGPSDPTRVVVRVDPEAEAQVTLLLVPRRLPRVSLEVSIVARGPESSTLVARITEQAGLPTSLDRLCWEPLVPAPDQPRSSLSCRSVRGDALRSIVGESTIAPGDVLVSPPFEVPSDQFPPSSPLVFRLLTRSPEGARFVSWAELSLPPPRPARPVSLERPAHRRGAPPP